MRTASIGRKTHETEIVVDLNLDGLGKYDISTGVLLIYPPHELVIHKDMQSVLFLLSLSLLSSRYN